MTEEFLLTLINEIRQQYTDMVLDPTAEMQLRMAEMAAKATWKLNLCLVCAWSSLALMLAAVVILIVMNRKKGKHYGRV